MKNIAKDLEISEEKRLEIYKEFEAFKVKVHEEQTHLSSEHCDQMKRLEELSYSKLVLFLILIDFFFIFITFFHFFSLSL